MSEPKGYVTAEYLECVAAEVREDKQHIFKLLRLQAGQRVLDVGCGPGTDTIPMATLVGVTGQVIGFDHDPDMIAEAQARARSAGVAERVQHQQGGATQLPFATGWFDAVRSERVLLHVPDRTTAFGEMVRVLRPGGWLVVADTDWGSLSIDSGTTDLERRLVRFKTEQTVHHGYSGRGLYTLFRQHQLTDLEIHLFGHYFTDYQTARYFTRLAHVEERALAAKAITAEELECWRADLDRRSATGSFFASVNIVCIAGRKTEGQT